MDHLNDSAFLSRLKNREAGTFDSLFRTLAPRLCDFISRSYRMNAHDAEEIAADALFKVYKEIATYKPGPAKFTTWVFQIAKNTAIDFVRKKHREEEKMAREGVPDLTVRPPSSQEEELSPQVRQARRALASLNQPYQEILRMKQSMTYEEISVRENIPVGTLRTRYSRAVAEFRAAYEREQS